MRRTRSAVAMVWGAAAFLWATLAYAQPALDRVPAGTVVALELTEKLTSATAKRGDSFGIRLARPIMVGDAVVLPDGTPGRGEVIEAQAGAKRGIEGHYPAKLILAARYLEFNGAHIPIRGFHLSSGAANASNTIIMTGHVSAYVHRGPVEEGVLYAGAAGEAKLATDIDLQGAALPPAEAPK